MERATDKEPRAQSELPMDGLFAELRDEFAGREDELIPMLQKVQKRLGYLPERALGEIARLTRLPAATVFGTATFYAQFRLQPSGKCLIRVCRGTACHVRGGGRILNEVEKRLGIQPGESTTDLEFALETVACIGACAQAPTMMIDSNAYGKMTTKKIGDVLKQRE